MPAVIMGCAAAIAITAGTAADVTLDTANLPEEGFQIGRFMLSDRGGALARAFIVPAGGLKLAGDQLTQGYVPAVIFSRAAVGSPRFGHLVKRNQSLTVRLDGNANLTASASFTSASGVGNEEMRPGRSIVVMGQDQAPASLAAAGTATLTITPEESGRIGRWVMADLGSGALEDAIEVTRVAINGREVFKGKVPFSHFKFDAVGGPWLDEDLEAGISKVSIDIVNNHGATAAYPCLAVVVVG